MKCFWMVQNLGLTWLTTVFALCELRKSCEHKNKMAALSKISEFQVGSRGVLTLARLCLGLKIEKKKTCCLMVASP